MDAKKRIGGRCWALLFALLLAGCSKSVPQLIEQAKELQARGDKTSAVIELKNALAQDPSHLEAHVLLGSMSADLGELLDAEKSAASGTRTRSGAGSGAARAGEGTSRHGQVQRTARRDPPLSKNERASTGRDCPPQGTRASADGCNCRCTHPIFPRDARSRNGSEAGTRAAAAAEGDAKTAGKLVEELAAAAPQSAEVWLFKGDLARAEGKSEDALAAYAQALKLQPSNVPARLSQAVVHISARDFDAARADIDAAEKIAPALPMLHFTRALLALREQKFDQSRDALQHVGRQLPQHMPSVLLSGSVFFSVGQLEQAQKAFNTYLTRYPGNVYARKMLAATLLRMAQPQSAAHVLSPLLAQGSQDAEVLSLAGQVFLQLGQVRKARGISKRPLRSSRTIRVFARTLA
jgi:predicted Zn-dependent protease